MYLQDFLWFEIIFWAKNTWKSDLDYTFISPIGDTQSIPRPYTHGDINYKIKITLHVSSVYYGGP